MNPHPPADWLEFWVRFTCGALLGVAFGFCVLVQSARPPLHLWLASAGFGVLFGLLAGWFGDGFWRLLARWFWW